MKTSKPSASVVIKSLRTLHSANYFMGTNGEPMITISVNGRIQSFDMKRENWKSWMQLFVRKQGWKVSRYLFDDICSELVAIARETGIKQEIFVRIANTASSIIVDLGRTDFQFVHINSFGFSTNSKCPVAFLRPNKQLALPLPVVCSQKRFIELFNRWFSVGHDYWILILVFILKSLYRGQGAYTFLVLSGPKGSGKSVLSKRIISVIDPNYPIFGIPPRTNDDVIVALANAYLYGIDNVSGISAQMADIFCSVSTGGGISKRKLYADHDETTYSAHNPCIFNGIDEPSTRTDFVDRTIGIELAPIDDSRRVALTTLDRQFEKELPELLGGFYQLLSDCMRILPSIQTRGLPRMTDYARLGIAAEKVLKLKSGSFLRTYEKNKADESERVFWADPVCCAIWKRLERHDEIKGTIEELRQKIFRRDSQGPTGVTPRSAGHLGSWLKRVESALNAKGIEICYSKRSASVRSIVTIRWKDLKVAQRAHSERAARGSVAIRLATPIGDRDDNDSL